MKGKIDFRCGQLTAAAVFLLLAAAITAAGAAVPARPDSAARGSAAPEPGRSEAADQRAVPPEVLETAERFRADEFAYNQNLYSTCKYAESRLEEIALVYICDEIEGEIFEVYEANYRYRALQGSEWEASPGYPSVYLVFRPAANGTRRWVCCFRDASFSFSPDGGINGGFMGALYESLMDADEALLWKLNAGTPLDTALEQTMLAKMCRDLPGDGHSMTWKQLALRPGEDGGTAYGLLLYYSVSGSPLIYSEKTERYESAIFSACWLPVAISYQKSSAGLYTVTGVWTPSEARYEEELRRVFPPGTAEDIFRNIDTYAAGILEPLAESGDIRNLFSHGPVWPEYTFSEALDDGTLLGLVQYYGAYDIYTAPIRKELARRFSGDPDSIRSILLQTQDAELQRDVLQILAEMGFNG